MTYYLKPTCFATDLTSLPYASWLGEAKHKPVCPANREAGTYYMAGRDYGRGKDFALGIDGIVGIENKIPQIPIAMSLDIKPFMEIFRDGELNFSLDPGIGVKFTF